MALFPFVLTLSATTASVALALPAEVSVICSTAQKTSCSIQSGHHPADATVLSSYNLSTNLTSGFPILEIVAPQHVVGDIAGPRVAAYAAGMAEGYQTAAELALFYTNVYEFGPHGPSKKLVQWVRENDEYTRQKANANADTDDYWLSVALVLDRFDGTLAGYAKAQQANPSLPTLTKLDLLWINLDGDLFDLQHAVGDQILVGRGGRAARMFGKNASERILRCSSLFKLTADRKDLFFGHATWDTYATAAPRTYKILTLPTRRNGKALMRTISMSSSPGFMSSIDDYYLVSEKGGITLGVIETSINIADESAYSALTPRSVLCWIRSMAANQLAIDAPSWAKSFTTEKSGTYNNQWLILDVAKAAISTKTGSPLASDTFWILEEVPGLIHAEDQSAHLNQQGYWPSFNEIYYPSTRKVAGAHGKYDHAMRYKLFAELQGNISSEAAMARVIAWNDYQHDPIAQGPSDAIMSRGDLGGWGRAGGGIDAKYSSITLSMNGLKTMARAGPTNDDQPPFCWTKDFEDTPHAGHPRCYDFKWEVFKPSQMLHAM